MGDTGSYGDSRHQFQILKTSAANAADSRSPAFGLVTKAGDSFYGIVILGSVRGFAAKKEGRYSWQSSGLMNPSFLLLVLSTDRGATSARVVFREGGMGGLNLVPDTAASYAATYWVITQPGISRGDQTGDTALITTHAIDV